MADTFVAAIDQGTTSSRCLLFDHAGRMVSMAQLEHRHHYPQPGWVEHDAVELWRNVTRLVPRAVRQAGIANQRETTVVWDPSTGIPVANAITWQDIRTADFVKQLKQEPVAALFREVSGLEPASYFAGPRLRWLLDHIPGLRASARNGQALFGTMETWLIWNL